MRSWLTALSLLLGPNQDAGRQPPVILHFTVDSTAVVGAEVPLVVRLAGGRPTHYRLGVRADLRGAAWQPYRDRLHWKAARSGAEPTCRGRAGGAAVRLYFQVKAAIGDQVEVVDGKRVLRPAAAESNVQTAAVCVTPMSMEPGEERH